MTDYQTDDMLKGRIVANRQMIKQCENEIRQLESVLKARGKTNPAVQESSVDDTVLSLSREIYEVVQHGSGANLAHLDNALKQFATAIIKEARGLHKR